MDQRATTTSQSGQPRKPTGEITKTFSRRYEENIDPLGQIKSRSMRRSGGDALRRTMSQNRQASRASERFEARGDQLLRIDWIHQRRTWEEELARRAPETAGDEDDLDDMIQQERLRQYPRVHVASILLTELLAEYLQPPEEDEEDLAYVLESTQTLDPLQHTPNSHQFEQHYNAEHDDFSDEEAYDRLFLEACNQDVQQQHSTEEEAQDSSGGMEMDISND